MPLTLRVLLIDEDPERTTAMAARLTAEGYDVLHPPHRHQPLADTLRDLQPDAVVIDLASPDRDTLEQMRSIGRDDTRPTVMFIADGDEAAVAEAVSAGVTAYVTDGVAVTRVRPLLDLAVAQFRQMQALKAELDVARQTLAERKLIERAKGIVMAQRGCDEEAAYRHLRKLAMDRGARLGAVAEQVVAVAKLLDV
ncbi:MAG: ANTAR domain-containing protein [Alphaproteobacteria bacterium]|nr:ANTAR domain-containing protein [Alphaproteobacteria bacterium]